MRSLNTPTVSSRCQDPRLKPSSKISVERERSTNYGRTFLERLDRDTSAHPRLPVSDECSDVLSEPRSEQAGVKRTLCGKNHRTVVGLGDRPKVFAVAQPTRNCYGIGEMLAPNRQGAVTNAVCSSHGNDIDSDGACVTGPQPYSEGENESFAGMLPVPSECGLEPKRPASAGRSSGGRMPRPSGRGGGHLTPNVTVP